MTPTPPINAGKTLATAEEAQQVMSRLGEVMDALVTTLEQETELVRAGRLHAAALLQEPKGELARLYVTDVLRLRASRKLLAQTTPGALADLCDRHEAFRSRLQRNLTVLATAHAVSEGIIRGVAGEMQRKRAPQTYGASGRAGVPGRNTTQPLAISRSL